METSRKVKMSMMAASALVAAAGALAPASAADFDAAAYPAVVEAPVVTHAVDHVDKAVAGKSSQQAKRFAMIAMVGGALAALIRLIGVNKVFRAMERGAARAAEVSVGVAGGAAKAVGRAVRSPLRYFGVLAGLVLIALTGVGFYDVEWIAGLAVGAATMGFGAWGVMRARAQMALARAPGGRTAARREDRVNGI